MSKPDLRLDRRPCRRPRAEAPAAERSPSRPRCRSRWWRASRSRRCRATCTSRREALEVFLEAFEGPLDLLLYLIRRQNLDILDIPIAEITRQYMHYIELMQRAAARARRRVPADGGDAGGDQVAHAAAAPAERGRRRRGRPARRAGAPPAGVRALQARRRGHRRAAAPRARHVPGVGRARRAARRAACCRR